MIVTTDGNGNTKQHKLMRHFLYLILFAFAVGVTVGMRTPSSLGTRTQHSREIARERERKRCDNQGKE